MNIDAAIVDHNLLGAGLGNPASWSRWLAVLRGAFALPMSDADREAFQAVAGDRAPPSSRVKELWCVCGRRSGKSRIAAAVGVYLSCFAPRKLAAGEQGEVMVIAASQSQAQIVFRYVLGYLKASPVLRQEIVGTTAQEVRLRGNVTLAVRAGNFRTVRGRTLLAAVLDEVSFFRDETSAQPDLEIYRALLPALATTNGMLIGISTPYRRQGLLHQKHRDYFGQGDPDVLVIAGSSAQFNPTLDGTVIERARASDPESARAEWDGEFRADINSYLDDETIEAAIDHGRPLELPPCLGSFRYKCFVDASGGRHDHYTIAIGHKIGERFICDLVRGQAPPFDPQAVTANFAALAKDYNVIEVFGDAYGAAWVEQAWRDCGLSYTRSELSKSELYLEALPLWTRGLVSIPDHKRLIRELRLLERRVHRSGKDSVDHGRNGSDDYVNALSGVFSKLIRSGYDSSLAWIGFGADDLQEMDRLRMVAYVASGGRFG